MARTASVDAIEKFRFNVYILNIALDPVSFATNFIGFLRGGFSEVSIPRQSTGAIEYRENIDSAHPILIPGITKYDAVTLKRGVTENSDFFRWANQVHDPNQVIATAIQRLRGDPNEAPPSDSLNFRRDILIVAYDRSGSPKKGWLLRDAWVSSYKPGDDMSASEDSSKLIEEIELKYESFEELTLEALISGTFNSLLGGL